MNLLPTVQDTKPVHVGSFRGFDVEVSLEQFGKHVLTLKGAAEHHVELGADALGNIMRVENALTGMDKQLEKAAPGLRTWSAKRKTPAPSLKSHSRRRPSSLKRARGS